MTANPISLATPSKLSRVIRTGAISVVVALSLLCFPHWLPWMVAVWVFWCVVLLWRGRPAYWPLFGCVLILIIRMVPLMPGTLLIGITMLVMGLVRLRTRRSLAAS